MTTFLEILGIVLGLGVLGAIVFGAVKILRALSQWGEM